MIVIDSVAALVPKAEIEGEMGIPTLVCRRGSCPRPSESFPEQSISLRRSPYLLTKLGRKLASCSVIRKRHLVDGL